MGQHCPQDQHYCSNALLRRRARFEAGGAFVGFLVFCSTGAMQQKFLRGTLTCLEACWDRKPS